ncbi:ATP-dependent endonuclease [Halobaculum litoreum]|uniref:ATP-dependent endonuclease n=1 Tax=Halobaculum litoreum TaxID=3031998 RepID=A0ABD5XS92_9EURY
MNITSISVQGYKSIRSNESVEIDDFTVLLGENNVGKSSVIDALRDYKDIFPVANQVDSDWAHSRNTNKELEGEIRFEVEYVLDDEEHSRFLADLSEQVGVGDTEIDRWEENDEFRIISHELVLHSQTNKAKSLSGRSNVSAQVGDSTIDLRKGGLREDDAEYLNYRSVDAGDVREEDIEYSRQRKGWIPMMNIIQDSIDSWKFIDAFRNPEDRMPARRADTLSADGENLTQVLLTLSGDEGGYFERISNQYAEIMSNVDGIRAKLPESNETTIVVDEESFDSGFELSEISAGSKEVLTLITQIIMAEKDADLLLIEEPELHLHPGAERKILDLVEKVIDRSPHGLQALISTHSNVFVHHLNVDSIYRVERSDQTRISPTSSAEIGADLRDLGYEYAGMFQSEAVVIVEGLTDRVALRTIGRRCGFDFDDYNVGILEMGSGSQLVKHSRPLVRLFRIFNIPYMIICDSDIGEELKNDDGYPAESPTEIEGRLIGHLNSDTSRFDTWEDESIESVHAWEEEELEHYILQDSEALSDHFPTLSQDEVLAILEECSELSPDDILKKLCEKGRSELGTETEPMVKKTDVTDISERIDLETVPQEFMDVLAQIASLVGASELFESEHQEMVVEE